MAIPFILHSVPCSFLFLSKVRISPKVTIACNGFCLLHHTKTWLTRDIISCASGTMFLCVIACTLLHRELRDYSLGQMAFAVFRALFAITQLLCPVSALLTSACKQASACNILCACSKIIMNVCSMYKKQTN